LSSRVRKDDWSCVWISEGSVGILVGPIGCVVVDEVVRFDIVAKVCNSREDRQRHGWKWVSVEVMLVEGGSE